MPKLNEAEIARRRAAAAEAARAEARVAWQEKWRMPLRGDIAEALGQPKNYLNQRGLREVIDIEFGRITDLQIRQIMSAAQAMLNACDQGKLPIGKLNLSELERRIGCKNNMLAAHAVKPRHRFYEARRDVQRLWEKPQQAAVQPPEDPPSPIYCRCCNTRIEGHRTINGYLPECWAEYTRWRQIDSGVRQRTA